MKTPKQYWTDRSELRNDPEVLEKQNQEFLQDPFTEGLKGGKTNRRDFLKLMGFGLTAATLAACQKTPVRYAVPYVNKPIDGTPGVANYYASTFWDGSQYSSVLVKNREGRPIFIEGNPRSEVTQGGVYARGHAHVLSLYDNARLKQPTSQGEGNSWDDIDNAITGKLSENSRIRFVTETILSPSTKALVGEFKEAFPNTEHVTYDPVSYHGILEATEKTYGKRVIPRYRFDKAQTIVGVNADFLGTWLSPVEFAAQYADGRKVTGGKRTMSRHIQMETNMTITGGAADLRLPIKPSHEGALLLRLYNLINNNQDSGGMELPGNMLQNLAKELKASRGKSLVVSGSNDPEVQILVHGINEALGNLGKTVDLQHHSNLRQGNDKAMQKLVRDMKGGRVDAVFFYNSNPAYYYPMAEEFKSALKNVGLKVSFSGKEDETATLCDYILPDHHPLEAWNDHEPYRGMYSLQQPTIRPLFDTRPFQVSLLKWLGKEDDYYKYIRNYWRNNLYTGEEGNFKSFWRKTLHDGVYTRSAEAAEGAGKPENQAPMSEVRAEVGRKYGPGEGIDLYLYEKVGIGAGRDADNPWLQEFPDPISKITWDNYLLVPVRMADENGWKIGDVVNLTAGDFSAELPVVPQPGLHPNAVALAVGYGRTHCGEAGKEVGFNAYPALKKEGDKFVRYRGGVNLEATGELYELARTQIQGTVTTNARKENIVKERTLAEFAANPDEIKLEREAMQQHLVNLYPDRTIEQGKAMRWAMAIDLNSCIGCGACVVSCQAENNIPVVGKKEVMLGREMHWIRIDRYYSSPVETRDDFEKAEYAEEFPEVVFQPMMCQHCDNAPCENVCPVLATVHSDEGLNQQVYNRCFGTRYCANNCPYKVRRFNWWDYTDKENFQYNPVDDLGRMVLNPDVTVRARGVMEKCSFCVQRIQEAKLTAKREGRAPRDSELHTACSKSCPTGCIKFGDLNDPESEVSKLIKGEGHTFFVIEEVKTLPSVGYLARIRNKKDEDQVVAS